MDSVIRKAEKGDFVAIFSLIKEMADYEKLSSQMTLTEQQFISDGTSPNPTFHCLVAEHTQNGSPRIIGYAMYYFIYSSFQGISMFLEDIYVVKEHRVKGLGTRLYTEVAKVAIDASCSQMDYVVLNWNDQGLKFHDKMGATDITRGLNYHLFRNERQSLLKLVEKSASNSPGIK